MKKKVIFAVWMSVFVVSACGVKEVGTGSAAARSMPSDQTAVDSGIPQDTEGNPETDVKDSPQIVGGGNVVKDNKIADLGGVLEQLSPLADNLDMKEIEQLSEQEKQRLVGGLDVLQQRQNIVVQDIKEALSDTGVEVDGQSGKVTMDEKILFSKNEDAVSEEGKAYLDSFFLLYAKSILSGENAGYISEIQVIGNTDTDGTYEYNMDLSQRRAEAVMEYCLNNSTDGLSEQEKKEIESLMTAVGRSYDDPVYDENGNIDMEASRRVEFNFLMNLD